MSDAISGGPPDPFAAETARYQGWYDTPGGRLVYEVERDVILRALPPLAGRRVLDLGTGSGAFAWPLLRRGAAVVGVDRSAAMLRAAAAAEPQPSLLRADAGRLPFGDATFDALLSVTMLEFVADLASVVAEACRVVRSGGRVVLAVLNARSPWWWVRRGRGVYAGAHAFTVPELRALLAPHGTVTIEQVVHFPAAPLLLAQLLASVDGRPGGAILLATLQRGARRSACPAPK